ncbi:MAG: sigma-E processing peptidase SpoIIGA [Lachnospiraceae bacterium]|nr:sigma-E processing peptidase SpoIIGA [Lachnospiraceae bacterium]
MIVYLDVIFFINLLYQFGILKVLAMLYKMKVTTIRLIVSAALGSFLYCICIMLQVPMEHMGIRIGIGVVIGVVVNVTAFVPKSFYTLLSLLGIQCILAFCLSGLLQLLPMSAQTGYLMLTASGAVIFLCLFSIRVKKRLFEHLKQDQSIYHICICHGEKMLKMNALLDTGNSLTDPISGEVVIIMQRSAAEKLFDPHEISLQPGYRMIPYHSIGKDQGLLEAFRLERLEVLDETFEKKENKVFFNVICAVYTHDYRNGTYEVILHPLMF